MRLREIGTIHSDETGYYVEISPEYRKAMQGLECSTYVQILWWFDKSDNEQSRGKLVERKPYKNGPETLGVFATRSPERPNPLAVTTTMITSIDIENGRLSLAWIDAFEGSPVLDIKPYTPSVDRVGMPVVPKWCSHWPDCIEASGDFDWSNEFNF